MIFDWEIGEVPPGWLRGHGAPQVINGDFSRGSMAAVIPPPRLTYGGECSDNLCAHHFQYNQRHKVRAWLDWFMKEYDE